MRHLGSVRMKLQLEAVYCSVLQCIAVYCSVLHCMSVCCDVLYLVAMHCSVLHCGAVRSSCSAGAVLHMSHVYGSTQMPLRLEALSIAVYCSASRYVALCCSALQFVAECCRCSSCAVLYMSYIRGSTRMILRLETPPPSGLQRCVAVC